MRSLHDSADVVPHSCVDTAAAQSNASDASSFLKYSEGRCKLCGGALTRCIHLKEPVVVGAGKKGQQSRQRCSSCPRSFCFRHERRSGRQRAQFMRLAPKASGYCPGHLAASKQHCAGWSHEPLLQHSAQPRASQTTEQAVHRECAVGD